MKIKKKLPWFNSNINNGISERCNLKESRRKTLMTKINSLTSTKSREVDKIMDTAEKSYYFNSLHDNRCSIKKIYAVCDYLLGRRKELPPLPDESKQELANRFHKFYTEKIQKIRDHLVELANDDSFTQIEIMDHISLQDVIETIFKITNKKL